LLGDRADEERGADADGTAGGRADDAAEADVVLGVHAHIAGSGDVPEDLGRRAGGDRRGQRVARRAAERVALRLDGGGRPTRLRVDPGLGLLSPRVARRRARRDAVEDVLVRAAAGDLTVRVVGRIVALTRLTALVDCIALDFFVGDVSVRAHAT